MGVIEVLLISGGVIFSGGGGNFLSTLLSSQSYYFKLFNMCKFAHDRKIESRRKKDKKKRAVLIIRDPSGQKFSLCLALFFS